MKQQTIKQLLTCLFLLLATAGAYSSNVNLYKIQAQINPKEATLQGFMHLSFHNPTEEPMEAIPIRKASPVGYFSFEMQIDAVYGEKGMDLSWSQDEEMDYVLYVSLPEPLAPGAKTGISIEFSTHGIRSLPGYYFVDGLWHPKAVVYRDGIFCAAEEEPALYEVEITFPRTYTLLASGVSTNETLVGEDKTVQYTADNITSFGFAFFKNLQVHQRHSNGVDIFLASTPSDESVYLPLLKYAKDVIAFYVDTFGFYPQPKLVILPGDITMGGGFPLASNIVVIHPTRIAHDIDFAQYITAHEIGHQFWGFDFAVDSRRYKNWLGLGLGIYCDRLFLEKYNPSAAKHIKSFFSRYMYGVRMGFNTTLMQDYRALSQLSFDHNNIISHGKGYTVIALLEHTLGRDRFFQLVSELLERYQHRYLSVKDFRKEAERIAAKDLGWFFEDWIYSNKTFAYQLDTVVVDDQQVRVVVERDGQARLPLEVGIMQDNYDMLRKPIEMDLESQELVFDISGQVLYVQLDPDNLWENVFPRNMRRLWLFEYVGLEVTDLQIPELLWNTNKVTIPLVNHAPKAKEAEIWIQTNSHGGGIGLTTSHIIEPGETLHIAREIIIKPVPGQQRAVISITDAGLNHSIFYEVMRLDFPYKNRTMHHFESKDFGHTDSFPPFELIADDNLLLYYLPDDQYTKSRKESIIDKRSNALDYLASLIYPEFADTISLFLFPDHRSKRVITGHTGMGWALSDINAIYEVYNEEEKLDPYHELVHLVSSNIGNPPAMFNEGHAVYHHKNKEYNGFHFDAWAKAYYGAGDLIPISELITFPGIGPAQSNPRVAYPQSASFVSFLVDTFGYDQFLKLYRTLCVQDINEGVGHINEIIIAVFGVGIDDLEERWKASLDGLEFEMPDISDNH